MTWLVVASHQDVAAQWAADRLQSLGISPLMVVTDADLAGAIWRHNVGDDGSKTRVTLSDGREIDSTTVTGTLNRLTHVPVTLVAGLAQDDRTYALQEMTALVLSWLESLPGPTLNPPDPRGLCGAWRSSAEWAMLGADAGLCSLPVSFPQGPSYARGSWQHWPPFAPIMEDVVVVGTELFAAKELDAATAGACRRLAHIAATPILGLTFEEESLSGASPLPDLRSGGDELIIALAKALTGP